MKQSRNYCELIRQTLEKLPRHTCVKFALFCTREAFEFINEEDKEIIKKTLDLVELWLVDSTKISEDDLHDSARTAAHTSTDAEYATAAANAAISYTNAAFYAAQAACYAAEVTDYTKNKGKKHKTYYEYLLSIITPLQKAIFLNEYNPN